MRYKSWKDKPRESIPVPECPNVRSLVILDCGQCFEGPIPASVRSLIVPMTVYEQLWNGALLECAELEELTLYRSASYVLQKMPTSLTSFRKLQTLNVPRWPYLIVPALDSCTNLKTLDLSRSKDLVDLSALSSCPNLQALNLSYRLQLVDVSALSSCRNLQTLDISCCERLVGMSAWGSCCNLQTLNLSACGKLVDVSALSSCPNLQILNMSYCQRVVDVSALGYCPNLQTPNLSHCRHLVDLMGVPASERIFYFTEILR